MLSYLFYSVRSFFILEEKKNIGHTGDEINVEICFIG